MKKKTILLTLIISVIVVFTGCTSGNHQGDTNTPAIDTPGNKELTDLEKVEQYISRIGGSDIGIVNVLGEGVKTVDEKNNAVTLRRYQTTLFGESLSMITSLEDGNITDMSITPKSGTYDDWFNRISGTLGKPDETIEAYQNQNEEVRASAWNLDEGSLTLQSACGTVLLKVNGTMKK
ncbi:hypothetical protein [Anaerosporobacter sp.]